MGECHAVSPSDYAATNNGVASDGTLRTGISLPGDFQVTRAEATWQDGCAPPTILVELSDGNCPFGGAQRLDILLQADAIDGATPTILSGLNTLTAEPDSNGITVRYTRPKRLTPSGTFGSCSGMPGSITFASGSWARPQARTCKRRSSSISIRARPATLSPSRYAAPST